jgi:adhesin transport system membrane fusion protein
MSKDLGFINSLYAQATQKTSVKVDAIFLSIILFFTFIILWASLAEIDELTRGEGKVIPANKVQTIQSLDGGTIAEILIQEGMHVKKGNALMKIDRTRFQASLEENQELYFSLLAKKSRLRAEIKFVNSKNQKEDFKIEFPKELVDINSDYIAIETRVFINKIDSYQSSIRTLEYQLRQKEQELKEIYSKKKQQETSLELTRKQKETIEKMVKSGSKSRVELLKIEDTYNTVYGELQSSILAIPRSQMAIKEAKSKIDEKRNEFKTESSREMQEVEAELKKIEARLVSDNDKLSKTVIESPVDGVIKQINVNTIGSVVKSGETLIEILPYSKELLVEAKISPKDIAFVNPAHKAIVKITAYDFSIYGGLEGNIIEISADSIKDQDSNDGKMYYRVVIKTSKNYLEKNGKVLPIIPGMIANVDIVTGKKTIMDFLLKPILKAKESSLHER